MVLSGDKTLLEDYVRKLEADEDDGNEDEEDDDDEEDEEDDEEEDEYEDDDEPAATGNKRKASNITARGQPAKKVRKAPSPGLRFHIVWRGREASESEVHSEPRHGIIKFTNKN